MATGDYKRCSKWQLGSEPLLTLAQQSKSRAETKMPVHKNERFGLACVLKEFIWIALLCLTTLLYVTIQVVKRIIRQCCAEKNGLPQRLKRRRCVKDLESRKREVCHKRPSCKDFPWKEAIAKHPGVGCTVVWNSPMHVRQKKVNTNGCQQNQRWEKPPCQQRAQGQQLRDFNSMNPWDKPKKERRRAKEDAFWRKNATYTQNPWAIPEVESRKALYGSLLSRNAVKAQKPWVVPQPEKKRAQEEELPTNYAFDPQETVSKTFSTDEVAFQPVSRVKRSSRSVIRERLRLMEERETARLQQREQVRQKKLARQKKRIQEQRESINSDESDSVLFSMKHLFDMNTTVPASGGNQACQSMTTDALDPRSPSVEEHQTQACQQRTNQENGLEQEQAMDEPDSVLFFVKYLFDKPLGMDGSGDAVRGPSSAAQEQQSTQGSLGHLAAMDEPPTGEGKFPARHPKNTPFFFKFFKRHSFKLLRKPRI